MAGKRWNTCNVLAVGAEARRLWQFDAKGQDFKLDREVALRAGEALPDAVAKSWSSLWQHKLNIASLPADRVFLRTAQFPKASFSETVAMAELQLEKLSPMPVGQVVWTIHCLSQGQDAQQTVIFVIAARDAVEEFLGKLEGQGYLADRLEVPALDLLLSTEIKGDGAWLYPEVLGGVDSALVAWWYGGVLRSLDLAVLPAAVHGEHHDGRLRRAPGQDRPAEMGVHPQPSIGSSAASSSSRRCSNCSGSWNRCPSSCGDSSQSQPPSAWVTASSNRAPAGDRT